MEETIAVIEKNRSCINPNQRSTTMENQGEQEPETWVTENYQDPNWRGFYEHNLIPGARFLYFALRELGLVSEPIPRYRLEAAVHEVFLKHGLVAGDWQLLEDCLDVIRQVDFIYDKIELRKAAQDDFHDDGPL